MKQGLTLNQIMAAISVLALGAIFIIPYAMNSRIVANETAAIRTLKYIYDAQANFAVELAHNVDNDDNGEYGTFGLLAGVIPTSRGRPASPPFLDKRFRTTDPNKVITSSGYNFRLFLPDRVPKGADPETTITDLREQHWCAYAWPAKPGETGNRAFFVNEEQIVYGIEAKDLTLPISSPAPAYSGPPFFSEPDITRWTVVR